MQQMMEFIYQKIVRMFILISDFLIDEQISSALLVEQKQFWRNKEKLNNVFPYETAMKILKIINNLGRTG